MYAPMVTPKCICSVYLANASQPLSPPANWLLVLYMFSSQIHINTCTVDKKKIIIKK